MILKFVLVCLLSVSIQANISDEKKILDTIFKYNYGIVKMARTGDNHFMKGIVSEEVRVDVKVWFESWMFSNLTFLADINDIRFSGVTFNENNATITTQENWTFSYVNLQTRKIELEPITIFYEMNYTLQRDGEKWKIVDIKHIKEQVFERKETHKVVPKEKNSSPKESFLSLPTKEKIASY